MAATMTYEDGMEIENFDHVEVGPDAFEGQITKLMPRSRSARVRYLDHIDARRDGEPKVKSAVVPVSELTLDRRDG